MGIGPGVAAGHQSTAAAGAEILDAGGSAVDAAVAMLLVACAAETVFTGLGGGGFATVYDPTDGRTRCIDFFVAVPGLGGRGPGVGRPIEIVFVGQAMPYEIGPATVAVPGVPAGARHLWQRWGRLPWADVVEPGRLASYGTPLPLAHAELLHRIAVAMCIGEGAQVFTRPDGSLLGAGEALFHPDHHRAYELLAAEPDAFYRGVYADALLSAIGDDGALDAEDLATYAVRESEPRVAELDAHRVYARGDDLDDLLATLTALHAIAPGVPLTDWRHDPVAATQLVAALRAPQIRAETTNLVAADATGQVCVLTSSLGLGSGVYVPGFGVHLNSMLGEGELVRGALMPGSRMGSMMSPLIAVDADGRPVVAAGAAGGSRIRPALVQSVLRMLAGETPQQAIESPRLNALPGVVRLEPGFDAEVAATLQAGGDQVFVADQLDAYFGGVSALSWLGGGADPRRSGAVLLR